MSKTIKSYIRDEYKTAYDGVDSACVVSVIGMNAIDTNRLRGVLHNKEIRLRVVKNTMARQAFAGTALEPLGNQLDGPCALVTGGSSIIDVAKFLVDHIKEFKGLELKHGIIEGDPDLVPVTDLAKMLSLGELRSKIVGIMLAPASKIAGAATAPAGTIAGGLKSIIEKLEKGETIARKSA